MTKTKPKRNAADRNFDWEAYADQAAKDFMPFAEKLKRDISKSDRAYREEKRMMLGKAYIFCKLASKYKRKWSVLVTNEYWVKVRNKPKEDMDNKEKFRFVLMFLKPTKNKHRLGNIGKYARVLEFLHRNGHKSSEIPKLLARQGGLEGWLTEAREADNKKSGGSQGSDKKNAANRGTKQKPNNGRRASKFEEKYEDKYEKYETLEILAPQKRALKALSEKPGSTYWIKVERQAGKKGWQTLVAKEVASKPSD